MANLTGEFIKASIANKEINQFLKIRDESYYHIISKLQTEQTSSQSLTYFTDKEISFIFDRELIETMFREIDESGNDCNSLRVYYAADPDKNGSTTIVLVGAYYTRVNNEVVSVTNVFSPNPKHAAIEYPGGGLRNLGYPTPDVDILDDDIAPPNITML